MQTVEIEIGFLVIPTICEALANDTKFLKESSWVERLVWFPALWVSGRWAHVYIRHANVTYHVTKLQSADLRYQENIPGVYKIRVSIRNLAKATLFMEAANSKVWWKFPWNNCNAAISIVLYGHPRAYGMFGTSFGCMTRRVLKDVQKLQAAQR